MTDRTFNSDDMEALLKLNRLREAGLGEALEHLENRFAINFSTHQNLAVYGSLAPGRSNYNQLSHLAGKWHTGYSVTGELTTTGWGTHIGYPALRWSPTGNQVPVQLFISTQLSQHWARLDEFEGQEYLRILVPVYRGNDFFTVANLYGARL